MSEAAPTDEELSDFRATCRAFLDEHATGEEGAPRSADLLDAVKKIEKKVNFQLFYFLESLDRPENKFCSIMLFTVE